MSLTVKLEIYEGPLDLLLHLIKKNEVDIYDIPIALITAQYLEYLELMEAMNIELAGEFLLMAATLTQIKSRMLLPVLDEEGEGEEEDPRMAIVRPLLEHMKLRDAADALERRDILNRDVFAREVRLDELDLEPGEELIEANLFELIDAFQRIVTRLDPETGLEIVLETKTIQEKIMDIIRVLQVKKQASFEEICETDHTKAELILTFLAILELARVGCLRLFQHRITGTVQLFLVENAPLFSNQEAKTGGGGGLVDRNFDQESAE
ncbi:chromosome segregation protein ScpA [Candidatus Woesearchaeota archaeon]|nr:MAG: chromosome segregation protein ScpA [Candidatus Woesearchaeota archaeon]